MTKFLLSTAAGLILGLLYSASPLTIWVIAATVLLFAVAGRGLPVAERRMLVAILATAFATRLLLIAGLFVIGIPAHNDLSIGSLSGDNAYYLGRALRARDILLGFSQGKYDFFVVTDEYGRTSYLSLLTVLQVIFGPTPFSMRVLNAFFFITGATVLFRIARRAYGAIPAFTGLALLLFLPSLMFSSISLLKESLFFLGSALLVSCCFRLARPGIVGRRLLTLVLALFLLWLLDDLRRGAVILAGTGIGLAVLIRVVFDRPWRVVAAAVAVLMAVGIGLGQPPVRARALEGVAAAAKVHGGHVFTVGHAYKLLDEDFYMNPAAPSAWPLTLTAQQAGRFVIRAAISFLVTPWPWEMASLSELAFLPEHLLWYLLLLALPVGLVAGWRRDPVLTALLIGFLLPTAAALALTNGNVGTLLRLRGLVTPYLIWLSALGLLSVAQWLLTARREPVVSDRSGWVVEGPMA